jgi:hypothetical protein
VMMLTANATAAIVILVAIVPLRFLRAPGVA